MPVAIACDAPLGDDSQFSKTRWSLIVMACQQGAPGSREALEKLCAIYWYPLYAFVRRKGYDHHEAEALTQAFFERFLEKRALARVNRALGRFRSFLLTALTNFLANEWHKAQAQKRGDGKPPVSFDDDSLETRYHLEPVDHTTPETLFELRWARAVLDQVMKQLRQEFAATGKSNLFEAISVFLTPGGKGPLSRAEIAGQLGMGVKSLDTAIHRLRRRYGAVLREQIALTVSSPAEIEEEIRYLMALFGK